MRKIGTITSSAALIFLGIWMIIYENNPILGKSIFKFWPVIFIILGIEMLLIMKSSKENEKVRINYLIIPVVIIFLAVNGFMSISSKVNVDGIVNQVTKEFKTGISFKDGFTINFHNNNKEIKSNKTLKPHGNKILLDITNADIKIKKSDDDNIKLETSVYVDKKSDIEKYEIDAKEEYDGYKISFNESYVKGEKIIMYIPNELDVEIDGSNLNVKSLDEDLKFNIDIDANNANVKLEGDVQKTDIKLSNGNVEISNKLCKDINIDMSNGKVSIDTEDENVAINADVNMGVCSLNSDKRINSGIKETVGNGEGNIEIDMSNGVVEIDTQE
ncbi:DUF5668 domain-containing protein [Clostridium aestuarii]|uniref:DUF5668 domain-containing protein n=1 Tax=Clostridium aestuarii TaxID=338193 RepID=A0ABT4D5Z0_9CLOT|nr:DUF5668 domain-containing protein [Clostridium aestuarii]MCY6485453.1 DUF5668 domain-containing protein [Clostridium aestuarii]